MIIIYGNKKYWNFFNIIWLYVSVINFLIKVIRNIGIFNSIIWLYVSMINFLIKVIGNIGIFYNIIWLYVSIYEFFRCFVDVLNLVGLKINFGMFLLIIKFLKKWDC